MSASSAKERPVYVEHLQHSRVNNLATSEIAINRVPIRPSELWDSYGSIPLSPAQSLLNDGDVDGVVRLYKQRPLALVAQSSSKFELATTPSNLAEVIPAVFGDTSSLTGSLTPVLVGLGATGYAPVIQDRNGKTFVQAPSTWVVDGINHFIEFPQGVPAEMVQPLTITFCRYIGTTGGSGGGGGSVTLISAGTIGGHASLVSDGAGPELAVVGISVTDGITLTPTGTSDLTIGSDISLAGVGAGEQLVADASALPAFKTKSLLAGANVTLSSTTETITISAAGGGGAIVTPANLDLWVSTTGNDTTGDGSQIAPYLTLQRAFQHVQEYGWNDTATVTIDSSGGVFALPAGEVTFNAGSKGAQRSPLRVKGSGRTAVATNTVNSATADSFTGLVRVTWTTLDSYSAGDRIRFTTGALSTYSAGGAFSTAVQVDTAIAEILGPSEMALPLSDVLPGPGDEFAVETFNTTLALTGVIVIRSDANQIVFEDLNIIVSPSGGVSGIYVSNTQLITQGVNITADPNNALKVAVINGQWFSGAVDNDLTKGFKASTKSLYIDTTAAGSYFEVAEDNNSPFDWSNVVVRQGLPSGVESAALMYGRLRSSYWVDGVGIEASALGPLVIDALHYATPSGQALIARSGAKITASRVRAVGGGGFIFVEGGKVRITNPAGLVLTYDASSARDAIKVRQKGSLVYVGDIAITNAISVGLMTIDGSTTLIQGSLSTTGCTKCGILTQNKSTCTVYGATTVDACGNVDSILSPPYEGKNGVRSGIYVNNRSDFTVVSANALVSNCTRPIRVVSSSKLLALGGSLSVVAALDNGFEVLDNSDVVIEGALSIDGGVGVGMLVKNFSRLVVNTSDNSSVINTGTGTGIVVQHGSSAEFIALSSGGSPQLSCSGNGVNGIEVRNGSKFLLGDCTLLCDDNGSSGLIVGAGSSIDASVNSLLTSSIANTSRGISIEYGGSAIVFDSVGNSLAGAAGDIFIGVNAAVTWATLLSTPAVRNDYSAASTQLCSVLVKP